MKKHLFNYYLRCLSAKKWMLDMNHNKRYAIYFFYDSMGIVDEYNIVLLRDLAANVDQLLVVSNSELTEEGYLKFNTVTEHIMVRENKGLDVWAFKEGMAYWGWDELSSVDELVMLNFTNFGPVYPLSEMFESMKERSCDFWGINMRYGSVNDPYNLCKYGYIPDHVPSSFIVIRNSLIHSPDFQSYWDQMVMINNYAESVCYHEAVFTKLFSDLGYTYELYINTEDLKEFHDYPSMLYPLELVKNRKCPFFKRKIFYNIYEEFLFCSTGQLASEFYEYLKNESAYDVNLIWDNLLRTVNMSNLKDRMQLNYILSEKLSSGEPHRDRKVALIMHLYNEDQMDYCINYANAMPEDADIIITTDTEAKKAAILSISEVLKPRRVLVRIVENIGRDVSALLVGCRDIVLAYDYICFVHDKKSRHLSPYIVGESFSYHCFENILSSREYVENVISTFENNERLGLLVPPTPMHSQFYSLVGAEWGRNFDIVTELAARLKLHVDINRNKPPIAPFGTMFWMRPKALEPLFTCNLSYHDFPKEPTHINDSSLMHAVERIYPFVAQNQGYYTGWATSERYAQQLLTNLYFSLRDINKTAFWHYGVVDRTMLLHIIGHPFSEHSFQNRGEFIGDGITVDNPDVSYQEKIEESRRAFPTSLLVKLLLQRILPQKTIILLQKIRAVTRGLLRK